MRERDSQRSRVYASDTALIKVAKPLPEVKDVERYCKRAFKSKRVQKAFPRSVKVWRPLVKVKDGRRCRRASGGVSSITIPRWARNEAVVTHELAHTFTLREHGSELAAHGWQFCQTYLKLTHILMGKEAHDTLKRAFKENRVKFRPPRKKRHLSPEQREQLVERMARAREARL